MWAKLTKELANMLKYLPHKDNLKTTQLSIELFFSYPKYVGNVEYMEHKTNNTIFPLNNHWCSKDEYKAFIFFYI